MKQNTMLWLAFITLSSAFFYGIFWILGRFGVPPPWAMASSIIPFAGILIYAVIDGWTIVPQQYEYVIEIFGRYIGKPLGAGPYLFFPLFGFVVIRFEVFLGDQLMELYLDDDVDEGFGGDDVKFKDCSSSLVAHLYFRIADSQSSSYNINELFPALEQKADNLLRSFLGIYTLEDTIKLKGVFNLEAMAVMADFCPHETVSKEALPLLQVDIDKKWPESDFYRSRTRWGVKPISLVITDVKLTPELEKMWQAILAAETSKKTTIIRAEGEKQSEILDGEGRAAKIRAIINAGVSGDKTADYLVQDKKWEAIQKSQSSDKVIIIEGNDNSIAGQGAKLGVGLGTNDKT